MFDFSSTTIKRIATHVVGNASREEGLQFSALEMHIDSEMVRDLLLKYFLSPFSINKQLYRFTHDIDLHYNNVYALVAGMSNEPAYDFHHLSMKLAITLYNVSAHPKVKSGEFYVVHFSDVVIEDELVDAVGIFKSEHKDTYLKSDMFSSDFKIQYENGIDINKLDKGCLIFNTEKEKGFVVAIVDGSNESDTLYWKKQFLGITPRQDVSLFTESYMNICREFIEQYYSDDLTKQIHLGSIVTDYFDNNNEFDAAEFGEKVGFNVGDTFEESKKAHEEAKNITIPDFFEIAPQAVKRAKKIFKNRIKLDNNFIINVNNDTVNLVKGFDEERNMKFYTLYYEEEK